MVYVFAEVYYNFIFDLLQVALGAKEKLVHTPLEKEWRELFKMAQKQTFLGIAYAGIEKLQPHQHPPRRLLLKWYGVAEQIKQKNEELNSKALAISRWFRNLIVKGAVISPYYKIIQLEQYRTPGNVDI